MEMLDVGALAGELAVAVAAGRVDKWCEAEAGRSGVIQTAMVAVVVLAAQQASRRSVLGGWQSCLPMAAGGLCLC